MRTINLLDANFAHDAGSVAGKPPSHFSWNRPVSADQVRQFDGPLVMTDGYISEMWLEQTKAPLRIGWLREPQCLWPDNYRRAADLKNYFDVILTYWQPLLDSGPPFRFAPYGGIWLPRTTWGIKPKTKNISMLIGSKQSTAGHKIRHEVYQAIQDTGLGHLVDFYGIYGTPVNYGWQTKYQVLADYRYTIISETCCEENLFTEILLDCLVVGTIPIFWGCPNYHEFFYPEGDGIIRMSSAGDLVWMLENLDFISEGSYLENLSAAHYNMIAAADYEITEDWLYLNVLRELL